ncbi:MAG: hypothetical protein FJ088_13200, partial [Deltaproteobacteria bacterium]|nr:hypothetical protein [Deltaproteobacteria bacterium]
MKKAVMIGVLTAMAVLSGYAQQKEDGESKTLSPDEVMTGEAHISLNSDYPKVSVDGQEWEEHEFTDNGMKLILHSIRRDRVYKISLKPIYKELEPVEIELKPEDWKLKTIEKNVKMWMAEKKASFQKKKEETPK